MYVFRFADEHTRDEVVESKMWHIANKPLNLRRWEPGMQLLNLSWELVPIWNKLNHLPMELWNSTCLSYVASGIGKPLYADSITEEQVRFGFLGYWLRFILILNLLVKLLLRVWMGGCIR
jgi:hypothetical protein